MVIYTLLVCFFLQESFLFLSFGTDDVWLLQSGIGLFSVVLVTDFFPFSSFFFSFSFFIFSHFIHFVFCCCYCLLLPSSPPLASSTIFDISLSFVRPYLIHHLFFIYIFGFVIPIMSSFDAQLGLAQCVNSLLCLSTFLSCHAVSVRITLGQGQG